VGLGPPGDDRCRKWLQQLPEFVFAQPGIFNYFLQQPSRQFARMDRNGPDRVWDAAANYGHRFDAEIRSQHFRARLSTLLHGRPATALPYYLIMGVRTVMPSDTDSRVVSSGIGSPLSVSVSRYTVSTSRALYAASSYV
jgi:hypothetical protein